MMGGDYIEVLSDMKVRDRRHDQLGAHPTAITFQVPVQGQAGTAISYAFSQEMRFGVAFRGLHVPHEQMIRPCFFFGFELNKPGPEEDEAEESSFGLIGTAHVKRWLINGDNHYEGAVCRIGVVNMEEEPDEETPVPFTGFCFLTFMAVGIKPPLGLEE